MNSQPIYSDVSAALTAARSRLIADAMQRQQRNKTIRAEYYGGGKDEEVVGDIVCSGSANSTVTRNHYGCLVLNAAHAMFIDVDDLSSTQATGVDQSCMREERWRGILDDLYTVLAAEADESFRIYRTAAGFRILATANEYDPTSPHSAELMRAAGADADFVELCRIQSSFRARLSPKPWRCGMRRPPNLFPRHTEGEQGCFTQWLSGYERASANRATCQFLGGIGRERIHPRIAPVIELHDRQTKAHDSLALA